MQEAAAARDAERGKLLETTATLRRSLTEARGQQARLQAQLKQERTDRRAAEAAATDEATRRRGLEAACEAAVGETSELRSELQRLQASLESRRAAAGQQAQVRLPRCALVLAWCYSWRTCASIAASAGWLLLAR